MQPRHTLQLQAERFNKTSLSLGTHVGGTTNQLSYDGFGRLAQLKYKSPNQQTLLQRQYQYDKLYRLTSADNPSGLPDEQYTYDKLGNRLLDNGKPNPAQTSKQWQYNGNNQLTQSATEDTATFGTNSKAINHSYDGNGNLTQLATQTGTELANPYNNQQYRYDAQNRLTAVQDNLGNLIASYQYDPYGQRIRKTIHRTLQADGSWQALTTHNTFSYFYRDEGLSAQYQSAGQDITTPKQIAQYGWLPNGVWGTNPVWINTAKRTTTTVNVNGNNQIQTTISPADYYYYQNDHLGTPQQLIDRAGKLVWQQQSTAFGEVQITLGDASNETNNTQTTSATGVIANPFRFAGQYFDIETNTNYNYHRQYAPSNGNYTQTDPIGLAGGLNRQAYVNGNPVRWVDPMGLCWGNAEAIAHAFVGGDVSLNGIGCYDQVTKNTKSQRESWRQSVMQQAEGVARSLPCNKSKSFAFGRSAGAQSGIFWIRGISLKQEATCKASKFCCDTGSSCCPVKGTWDYSCDITSTMHDPWEDPIDWKDKGKDFWDHWQLGTKKFYVNGTWQDSASDSGEW